MNSYSLCSSRNLNVSRNRKSCECDRLPDRNNDTPRQLSEEFRRWFSRSFLFNGARQVPLMETWVLGEKNELIFNFQFNPAFLVAIDSCRPENDRPALLKTATYPLTEALVSIIKRFNTAIPFGVGRFPQALRTLISGSCNQPHGGAMKSIGNFHGKYFLSIHHFLRNNARSHSARVLLGLLLSLALTQARAQLYTGSITGVVTDPSSAVVAGAGVTLTDTEKGYESKSKTDNSGRYLFRSVPPGIYRISVEAKGFETARQEGVKVDVNQNVSSDLTLRVGAETQVVDVKAGTVQVQTEDAVTGQVVNRRFVNDLPLLDRDFFNLTRLAPGVVETNVPNSSSPVNFNSNGSRNSTADVLIDGASATNFEQNSGQTSAPYTPSVDSVEEFKVEQSNFTAEFGFAGTSIINVVTRSGTNQFHGSAFEFLRNSATDANEWFANKNGEPIPPLKKHDFGGSIGGPIFKNKTFFFVDYEGRRERNFASNTFGVPTLCERGIGTNCAIGDPNNLGAGLTQGASKLGNFAEICLLAGATFDSSGQCSDPAGQFWDPYTGVFPR